MAEIFVPIAFWFMVLFPIGVFIWLFRRVRRSVVSKIRGIVQFFCYSVTLILVYATIFLVMTGVQRFTDISVISEGYARTLLPIVGLVFCWTLILTAVFAVSARVRNDGKKPAR
jgi:hypothetical protein